MYEGPIQALIDELSRLPGIGPKSAQRLAFWLIKAAYAEPGISRPERRGGVIWPAWTPMTLRSRRG